VLKLLSLERLVVKMKREKKKSEGARSVGRGMGKGMVDSSPTHVGLTKESGVIVVWSRESDREEESVRKTEGSGSGEAAKGLVRLGKNAQEPVPSEQETLADLLKRVNSS